MDCTSDIGQIELLAACYYILKEWTYKWHHCFTIVLFHVNPKKNVTLKPF